VRLQRPTPTSQLRRPAFLILDVVAGLVLAFGIDLVRSGGPIGWMARRGIAPPYEPRGQVVRVDGRSVYVDCRGAGSPTVILDSGYGSGAGSWGFVLDEVAATTRICTWDRPGLGRSESRGLHSAAQTAVDLRATLAQIGATPPFVYVGHSLGGLYGRVFTAAHRDEVAGLVMVDAYWPDLALHRRVALPDEYVAAAAQNVASTGALVERGEELDWEQTLAELAATGTLGQPTEILAVDQHFRFVGVDPATQEALIDAWEAALLEGFPNARITIAHGSDHMIQLRRPELVVEATRRLIDGAR
jgi:pimeloyl-ACP methyl ester carboxylesterase